MRGTGCSRGKDGCSEGPGLPGNDGEGDQDQKDDQKSNQGRCGHGIPPGKEASAIEEKARAKKEKRNKSARKRQVQDSAIEIPPGTQMRDSAAQPFGHLKTATRGRGGDARGRRGKKARCDFRIHSKKIITRSRSPKSRDPKEVLTRFKGSPILSPATH